MEKQQNALRATPMSRPIRFGGFFLALSAILERAVSNMPNLLFAVLTQRIDERCRRGQRLSQRRLAGEHSHRRQ